MTPRRVQILGALIIVGTLTLYGLGSQKAEPLPPQQFNAISRFLGTTLSFNGAEELVGEPGTILRSGGSGVGNDAWSTEIRATIDFTSWHFPRDDSVPDIWLELANQSDGPRANTIQVTDRGGYYNHLLIPRLIKLFEENGWRYRIEVANPRPDASLIQNRALMRKQYLATKSIIDQVASADWRAKLDPNTILLDISPGRGYSERRDSWGYKIDSHVLDRSKTGSGIETKRLGLSLWVEGGLSRDGVSEIVIFSEKAELNRLLVNELVERFNREGWEFELLHVEVDPQTGAG